jgi:hypothetical protein
MARMDFSFDTRAGKLLQVIKAGGCCLLWDWSEEISESSCAPTGSWGLKSTDESIIMIVL